MWLIQREFTRQPAILKPSSACSYTGPLIRSNVGITPRFLRYPIDQERQEGFMVSSLHLPRVARASAGPG